MRFGSRSGREAGRRADLAERLIAQRHRAEAVPSGDPDETRQRLVRRIAQVEEELAAFARELGDLEESPLSKLKVMVDEAAARGKDLIADQIRRLKRDIIAARNRLDAMTL